MNFGAIKKLILGFFPNKENIAKILAFLHRHQILIASIGLFVFGLLIGLCLKQSELEKNLTGFLEFTKSEEKTRESQTLLKKRVSKLRIFLILILILAGAYLVYAIKNSSNESLTQIYFSNQRFTYLFILALIFVLKILALFTHYRLRQMESRLRDDRDKKGYYLKNFINLIGDKMMESILKEDRSNKMEFIKKLQDESNQLAKENTQLISKLNSINADYKTAGNILNSYIDFYNDLIGYTWCEICYNETEIKKTEDALNDNALIDISQNHGKVPVEISETEELIPKNEIDKEIHVNENRPSTIAGDSKKDLTDIKIIEEQTENLPEKKCQAQCLVNYHIFCQHLNLKFLRKLERTKLENTNSN